MAAPKPLPPELSPAFSTGRALSAGASPRRLRAKDLDHRIWGVRSVVPADSHLDRARALLTRMPGACFLSHASAALLHGLPVPLAYEESDAVDLGVAAPERAPHAKGIRGHRLVLADHEIGDAAGLRATTPIRTWFDLGSTLQVPDLVAAGDVLLALENGPTRDALGDLLERHAGERGVRRLRTALAVLNPRAESPQESRLRAMLMLAGLPEPSVNREITDRFGRFLARVDLAYDAERVAIEYQGDYHRERAQWKRDITRKASIEAEGWRVLEVTSDDMQNRSELVARVRRLLRDGRTTR